MNTTRLIKLGMLLTLFIASAARPLLGQELVTIASSYFDDTNSLADGWQGTNNTNGPEHITYLAGGASSNSVGCISVSEAGGDSATMYLVAPAKFLGDQHAAYNGFLRFSLKQLATNNLYGATDFVILGNSNILLGFSLRNVPRQDWHFFDIPLNESVGWQNVSSHRFASKDDFYTALKSVTQLWIRGEYSSNNHDETDLDDVELLGQPPGPTQPLLAAATYAGITIDAEVGASYHIEYRDTLFPDTNWLNLTNILVPNSPYLFIDQTSPSASSRFYRATLNP